MINLCRKLLEAIGINKERLRIEWASAAEGSRIAKVITDFIGQLKEIGPLGKGNGEEDGSRLKLRLEVAKKLVPYIKLVESHKLRSPSVSEEDQLLKKDEEDKLFRELVVDQLWTSEILLLLKERCLSIEGIFEIIGGSRSEVSRYLDAAARRGLVMWKSAGFTARV